VIYNEHYEENIEIVEKDLIQTARHVYNLREDEKEREKRFFQGFFLFI